MAAVDDFLVALRAQESGGNYQARNPSGASGAYQFMPGTWANYKGYANAADAPPAVQDERARQLAQQYYDRFGNWSDVAKAWYTGPGFASKNQTAKQGAYPSIQSYADQVTARMGGGNVATAVAPPVAGQQAPQDPVAYARATYGYLAAYLDDPEIGPILQQAAREGWDLARLQGAIYGTDWWKRSSEAVRKWDALQEMDPAQADALVQKGIADIREQARALGVPLPDDRLQRISMEANRFGWDQNQIKAAIFAEVDFGKQPVASPIGASIEHLKQIADSYGVWLPDDQAASWAKAIAMGDQTEEAFKATWGGVAKAFYQNPALDAVIDAGGTTADYARQFLGPAGQMLEQNYLGFNLKDPKWNRFLSVNPETGQPWTQTDMQRVLRSDAQYGYDNTLRAVNDKLGIGMGALRAWGFA